MNFSSIVLSVLFCGAWLGGVDQFTVQMARVVRILAIKELPQPHFKVHECPKTFGMILTAGLMSLNQLPDEIGIENTTTGCAVTQNIFIDHCRVFTAEPGPNRDRKAHLRTRQDRVRQN